MFAKRDEFCRVYDTALPYILAVLKAAKSTGTMSDLENTLYQRACEVQRDNRAKTAHLPDNSPEITEALTRTFEVSAEGWAFFQFGSVHNENALEYLREACAKAFGHLTKRGRIDFFTQIMTRAEVPQPLSPPPKWDPNWATDVFRKYAPGLVLCAICLSLDDETAQLSIPDGGFRTATLRDLLKPSRN